MRRSAALSLAAGGMALAGVGYVAYNALEGAPTVFRFDIRANPRVIDEGALVEFEIRNIRAFDPISGQPLPVSGPWKFSQVAWGFDDGSTGTSEGHATRHRFADNRLGGYEVVAQVENSRNWVKVKVNNVAPKIRSFWHSRPMLEQAPIGFEALAVDPGIEDELTFNWDFGDGNTTTGQRVDHTYDSEGVYAVTVTVDDGDLGQDQWIQYVAVGEVGAFDVSGGVSIPRVPIETVLYAGHPDGLRLDPRNPLADPLSNEGTCTFSIHMAGPVGSGSTEAPNLILQARLPKGLGVRRYQVAPTDHYRIGGAALSDGVFQAQLTVPESAGSRGMPFAATGGRVEVRHFDGEFLDLGFDIFFVESIDPSWGPRNVRVNGVVAQKFNTAPGGSLEAVGSMMSEAWTAWEQVMAGVTNPAPSQPAGGGTYMCGVDDEEPFDIVARKPVREAINAKFLNPEVEIQFTEAVDPATIHDNVDLEIRTWGGFESVKGTWQALSGDPTIVQFVPQDRLIQGAIHCVRVTTGTYGLRSQDGSELEPPAERPFSDKTRDACESEL